MQITNHTFLNTMSQINNIRRYKIFDTRKKLVKPEDGYQVGESLQSYLKIQQAHQLKVIWGW